MKKLLLLGALALASLTSNAENVEGYLDRSDWAITACSFDTREGVGNGVVTAMYDDNLNTYYHQNWTNDTGRGTHWIIIDMGSEQQIHGLDIWGRQGHINGHVEKAKIYASKEAFADFADHDAAKAYYDDETNVPVGTIDYTYNESTRNDVQSVRFEEVTARYLLIVTDKTSQNHLCIAEIKTVGYVPPRIDLDRTGWTITACSVREDEGPIANMIDDNLSTYYHQAWGSDQSTDAYHWLMIDLGQEENVGGFEYWRRQGWMNGQFITGKVYVSNTPFEAFATHYGAENDAKAYYEDPANVAASEFNFTYDRNPDMMRRCDFPKAVKGRYVLILLSDAGTNNVGRHLCCAELKIFKLLDDTAAKLLPLWEEGLNAELVTRAGYLQPLGSFIGKGSIPSTVMPDDITEDNFDEKLAEVNAALEAYVNSFAGQLIYIQHATRRNHAYLAALPAGNGVRLNTLAEPTADAVWEIRFMNNSIGGFYLYSRTTNTWISTQNSKPTALTESASVLTTHIDNDGYLAFAQGVSSSLFNVDDNGNDLVWYSVANDGGSKWTATAVTVDDQVYVEPEVSTAEAPKYYRLVNARWMHNNEASNMAVNGENQDGNGNGETITRSNAVLPGIYWRVESNGEGVKLVNLTGYELTFDGGNLVTATDNGSTVYLIKQTDQQFHGVIAYGISNSATQGFSCLDVSDNNAGKFCWSPTNDRAGNGNNGSAWYFLAATENEIANATATYVAGVKDRMILRDNSLGALFGGDIYKNLTTYNGEETIAAVNEAKASGNYAKTAENIAAVNAVVNAKVAKLVDRHFLLHNCNVNYSNCYMGVANDVTTPTADASDVNALWSFVPNGDGYLLTSAATGNSLSLPDEAQSRPIHVVEDGLPYSIAYNAKIPGFYFTLVPTDEISDTSIYSVHQSNNSNICKWYANDILGSHWTIEPLVDPVIRVEKDGEAHSITLPEGVTLNAHESAANHVLTITKKLSEQEEEDALLAATFSLAPVNGVHTVSASDFSGNSVELSGVVPGVYKVAAPAGMFLVNGKPSAAIDDTLIVDENGATTGVNEVSVASDVNAVYDLQGRRVKGNAKGLLIVNGKKTVVK